MKIILSRKGFDSSAGGCPNPVLPDGRLVSLPIPDPHSPIRYRDIDLGGDLPPLKTLVSQLNKQQLRANSRAHLDPDLTEHHLPREPSWRPVLGQHGSAQGHLEKQGVGIGDTFVFFALFQPVVKIKGRWQFDKTQPPFHAIWGWLTIGRIVDANQPLAAENQWLQYHPHLHLPAEKNNKLYVARDSGVFSHLQDTLKLTAPDAASPTQWRLPRAFYPSASGEPLSYHHKRERWSLKPEEADLCRLQAVARGQEFVIDSDHYPELQQWLAALTTNKKAAS